MNRVSNSGRRRLWSLGGLGAAAALGGCLAPSLPPRPLARVLVVGGGWGGAAAARHLKRVAGDSIEVLLVERAPRFVSCPLSNLALGGSRQLDELTFDYAGLRGRGVQVLHDEVAAIDPVRKRVSLRRIADQGYDKLIVAPGVDPVHDAIHGLDERARPWVNSAWKAGPETVALRRLIEAMPEAGTFLLAIPRAPFSGPAGPYERVCQVAHYLRRAKPRARILVLDANPAIHAKADGFREAWTELYGDRIEYRPDTRVVEVHAASRTAVTADDRTFRADVVNVILPQRAGELAHRAGLVSPRGRWARVDWLTMESVVARDIHVVGDATLGGPDMPKTGHLAIQHGQSAAQAILAQLGGRAPPEPAMTDSSFSFIDDRRALHATSALHWVAVARRLERGGPPSSGMARRVDGGQAYAWARQAWIEVLG